MPHTQKVHLDRAGNMHHHQMQKLLSFEELSEEVGHGGLVQHLLLEEQIHVFEMSQSSLHMLDSPQICRFRALQVTGDVHAKFQCFTETSCEHHKAFWVGLTSSGMHATVTVSG